jgi:hypothetical protein
MDFITELVPNTEIVKFKCPVTRLMNTQDYDDVKFEIALFYQIKGFYTIVGPQPTDGSERKIVYGEGPVQRIEIFDESLFGMVVLPLLLTAISGVLFV